MIKVYLVSAIHPSGDVCRDIFYNLDDAIKNYVFKLGIKEEDNELFAPDNFSLFRFPNLNNPRTIEQLQIFVKYLYLDNTLYKHTYCFNLQTSVL